MLEYVAGMCWDMWKFVVMHRDMWEYLEYVRMYKNLLEYVGMCWLCGNMWEWIGICENMSKYAGLCWAYVAMMDCSSLQISSSRHRGRHCTKRAYTRGGFEDIFYVTRRRCANGMTAVGEMEPVETRKDNPGMVRCYGHGFLPRISGR